MGFPKGALRLPDWAANLSVDPDQTYASIEERTQYVIELSRSKFGTECLDAIHCSGVRHLACGARSEDAEEIGEQNGQPSFR
jgi:endonuclease IV